jgi:hypothetical protein
MIRTLAACAVALSAFGLPLTAAAQSSSDADRESALATLSALGSALPAIEGGECFSQTQLEAQQVMQLHTELMVASLTCPEAYDLGGDLYQRYRAFTVTHADKLRVAQRRLEGMVGGQEAFDDYRTDLANAEAQLVVELSIGTYCAMRESRFNSLIDAEPVNFNDYVEELAARQRLRQSGC